MTSVRRLRKAARRAPWADRNYLLLTAAATITGLGSAGALIAAAFAVLRSGGGATQIGLVAAARTVPLVLFLLVGGAVADRLPRHRVMVAANVLNCLSQAAFAALVLVGEPRLWQMVLLAALGGTGQAFFAPASEGMLLAGVSGPQAGRAFAVFRTGVNGAAIGGAALGGALVAAVGPGWVLAADAAAFALAAALRAFLDVGPAVRRERGGGLLREVREGWREVTGRLWLWSVVAQFAVVNAVLTAAQSVYGPLVARERLGGAGPWGLALAAFGAGTVLGALVMTRWKPRRMLLAGVCAVFPLALSPAALAVGLSAPGLSGVMLLCGICVEVFAVSWMTALHQEVPEDRLSRVSSYDWLGSVGMVPLATALAGPVQQAVGRTAALWGCAALIVLLTAVVLCVPDVRHLSRRRTPSPESDRTSPEPGRTSARSGRTPPDAPPPSRSVPEETPGEAHDGAPSRTPAGPPATRAVPVD
ncbi:MFS transporter [Streptomyces sp. MST-110588]|uniref:MFS transporter n=1 Tax=Streptomyces sp. MST-110588 TaxID=2833628 RepID=UPI001F5C30FE|nr:MFS transporter [Streptomyces sp. MST-110588]UNO41653.1 MFS transporter [Streptomyces sp. MST-110588]